MGYRAAKDLIDNYNIDPMSIDMIISIGEEWKEYPLTTSSIYIQEKKLALIMLLPLIYNKDAVLT